MSESRALHRVALYTDGACLGNPGVGGWGFVLRHEATGKTKEGSDGQHHTTNNRMELLAVIRGLEALKSPCVVEIVSDSEYVIKGLERLAAYAVAGFHRSVNSPKLMKNSDLWRQLHKLILQHTVTWRWTRGHVGHPDNERCDQLATAAAMRAAAQPAPPLPAKEAISLFEEDEPR